MTWASPDGSLLVADELDPSDWLASQFGEDSPPKPARRRGRAQEPPAAEPDSPAVAASSPPEVGSTFAWALTPSAGTPEPEPAPTVPPVIPTAPVLPPQPVAAPTPVVVPEPVTPPVSAPPLVPPPLSPPELRPSWSSPGTSPGGTPPELPAPPQPASVWDIPTVATPVQRTPPVVDPAPTVAFSGADVVRQEFPGFGTPVDQSIEGVTEVLGAHHLGIEAPDDEGPETSAIDSLFGDAKFVEYEDAIIPVLPPRASGSELVVVDRPRVAPAERASLTQLQKVLLGVVGGLVAVLLLIVLFLVGNRIAQNAPAPAVAPDPSPSATAEPIVGPLPAGEYYWDQLQGGECITPFVSAWEDTFSVVPCTEPHQAQLVLKGAFPATEDPAYPGVDALQALVVAQCAVPTVIDYAAAGGATDIQLAGSFAADEQAWTDGDRAFSCFAYRTGGAELATSIGVPQPEATTAP